MFLSRSLLLAAIAVAPFMSSAADAVVGVSSSAYDVGVTLNATGAAGAAARIGTSAGAGGAAYDDRNSVAAINQNNTLASNGVGTATTALTTGVASTQASSGGAATSAASASATINNASFGLNNQLLGLLTTNGLLSLSAGTTNSTASVGLVNGVQTGTGSTTVSGLNLGGSLVGTALSGVNYLDPTANTLLLSLAGLTIYLNEQIRTQTADGLSMQTNAIHIALDNYLLDGVGVSGDVVLGHSEAAFTAGSAGAVPEPATWAMMLIGMGLVGATIRRSGPLAATPLA